MEDSVKIPLLQTHSSEKPKEQYLNIGFFDQLLLQWAGRMIEVILNWIILRIRLETKKHFNKICI